MTFFVAVRIIFWGYGPCRPPPKIFLGDRLSTLGLRPCFNAIMHVRVRDVTDVISSVIECEMLTCFNCHKFNRPIRPTMCIAQFNLYLVVLVVAILPITRPAIASHNLARFNPGINPTIPGLGLSKLNPEIPGLAKRSEVAFPKHAVT